MKENTGTIIENIFTHFPSNRTRTSPTAPICQLLKKKAHAYKGQLQNGVAAMGIGSILLISVYLFLTQLAEYGWK